MEVLTINHNKSNLSTLSGRIQAGTITPEIGSEMTATIAVFFCLSFFVRVKACLFNGGLHGASFGWAAPICGGDNPMQSATRNLSPSFGGLSTLNRIDRMNTNSPGLQSAQQNPQTKTVSLFDCFLHRRQIAYQIPGTKAEKIKRHHPEVIVKFAGFGGAL